MEEHRKETAITHQQDMHSDMTSHLGLAGVIAAKITCLVGMHLGLFLGLVGVSGIPLPVLDPLNRALAPISLPLFAVSFALMAYGAIRRGPVALALVVGGGLLLYAAVFAHGMNLPLYSLALAMLLTPFLASPVWRRVQRHRARGLRLATSRE